VIHWIGLFIPSLERLRFIRRNESVNELLL
jgi:hypothetical protein